MGSYVHVSDVHFLRSRERKGQLMVCDGLSKGLLRVLDELLPCTARTGEVSITREVGT